MLEELTKSTAYHEQVKTKMLVSYLRGCISRTYFTTDLSEFLEYTKLENHNAYVNPHERVYTTRSVQEIVEFGKSNPMLLSWKLDGQPLSLFYKDGILNMAVYIDEDRAAAYDVTHAVKQMQNVPDVIPYRDVTESAGVAVINWRNYKDIRKASGGDLDHPGKLCSDTLRNPDADGINQNRLEFIACRMVNKMKFDNKTSMFDTVEEFGFKGIVHLDVVRGISERQVRKLQNHMNPFSYPYPATGLLFEHDLPVPEPVEETGTFQKHVMALTWNYEIYDYPQYELFMAN